MTLLGWAISFVGVFVVFVALVYRIAGLARQVEELTEHAERCDARHETLVVEVKQAFAGVTAAMDGRPARVPSKGSVTLGLPYPDEDS